MKVSRKSLSAIAAGLSIRTSGPTIWRCETDGTPHPNPDILVSQPPLCDAGQPHDADRGTSGYSYAHVEALGQDPYRRLYALLPAPHRTHRPAEGETYLLERFGLKQLSNIRNRQLAEQLRDMP